MGESLGVVGRGTVPYDWLIKARGGTPAELVVCVVRDPVDRLRSTFTYAHGVRRHAAFWRRNRHALAWLAQIGTLDRFVRSPTFPVFVRRHFFLWQQVQYMGSLADRLHDDSVVMLRFESLAAEAMEKLSLRLPRLNPSPVLPEEWLSVSSKAEARIRWTYAEDYALLAALR